MIAQEQCIVDGKPLSDGEIELIRAMRNHLIFHILGASEYDDQYEQWLSDQFSVVYMNDDYKLKHMDNAVVIELLDKESQEHVANIFKQIKREQ